jgi:hypothetical protein
MESLIDKVTVKQRPDKYDSQESGGRGFQEKLKMNLKELISGSAWHTEEAARRSGSLRQVKEMAEW